MLSRLYRWLVPDAALQLGFTGASWDHMVRALWESSGVQLVSRGSVGS